MARICPKGKLRLNRTAMRGDQMESHHGGPRFSSGKPMTLPTRRQVATSVLFAATVSPALAQPAKEQAARLFKVITVRDEVTIGLSAAELAGLGGSDAGAVAKALVAKGTLEVWQYAVRKAANGDLEQAPLRKIGLIAHDSLRVEPYATPLKVLAHE